MKSFLLSLLKKKKDLLIICFVFSFSFTTAFATVTNVERQVNNISIEEGLEILKYENYSAEVINDNSELALLEISNSSFENLEDDLLINSTSESISHNHYGDEPPNNTITWWDDDSDSTTPFNFRYRKCFSIDNSSSSDSLNERQVYLNLDTQSYISNGFMTLTGQDIRFIDEFNNQLDFYIAEDINTSGTKIWLQLQDDSISTSHEVCMYFGYVPYLNDPIPVNLPVSDSNELDTFSYSSGREIYYVVADSAELSSIDYGSYADNNEVTIETDTEILNEFDTEVFGSPLANNIEQETAILTDAPVQVTFDGNASGELAPASAAGTEFVYRIDRYTNQFSILSPYCTANVEVRNENLLLVSGGSFTVNQGSVFNLTTNDNASTGIPNDSSVLIESTNSCPILVSHHSTGNQDQYLMFPANTEWYGVSSGSTHIAAIENGTVITVYQSNNTTSTINLNAGEETTLGGGTQGTGNAIRLVSNNPIGVMSLADGDGTDGSTYLPLLEMDTEYQIPFDSQYIAISTIEGRNTTVEYYTPADTCGDGTPDGGTFNVNATATFPGKIFIGSASNITSILAGSCIVSNNPISLYHEISTGPGDEDEHNLFSFKQNRQFTYPEPTTAPAGNELGVWNLGTANTWNNRIPVQVDNNSTSSINEYQIFIDLEDPAYADLITNAQANGGDIRVAGALGDGSDNQNYWIESYLSNYRFLWFQTGNISPISSEQLYLYYNSTTLENSTGSRNQVFTTQNIYPNYYVLDSQNENYSSANAIGFIDGTTISHDGLSEIINSSQIIPFPLTSSNVIAQETAITANAPLHAAPSFDATDSVVPIGYAGTEFVYLIDRESDIFSFYAPFADANIQIQQSSGTGWSTIQTVNLTQNTATSVNQDIINDRAFKILSNEPILAFHRNGTSDSKILYPSHLGLNPSTGNYELYGIPSQTLKIAAANSGTNVTIYRSNGTQTNITLDNSNNLSYEDGANGTQGTGVSVSIEADGPIGVSSLADSDGSEAVTFVSAKEFSTTYLVTQDTQYFSVNAPTPNTTCRVFDENGVEITSGVAGMDNVPPITSSTNSAPFPNLIQIGGDDTGDGAFFTPGDRMECDNPVYAYYEHHQNSTITDETSWLTIPQGRIRNRIEPIVNAIDLADLEGLYYDSGRTVTSNIASFEGMIDLTSILSSEHVHWDNIILDAVIPTEVLTNGITDAYNVFAATSQPSPDCNSATYTFVSLSDGNIPLELSDNQCFKFRIELVTGDEAFTPVINSIEVNYSIPNSYDDILNLTQLNFDGEQINRDRRVFKIITNSTNLDTSLINFELLSVSNDASYNNFSFSATNVNTSTSATLFGLADVGSLPFSSTYSQSFNGMNFHTLNLNQDIQSGNSSDIEVMLKINALTEGIMVQRPLRIFVNRP